MFTGAQVSQGSVVWAAGGRGLAHTRDHLKIIESYYSVATSSHSAQLPRGLGAVDSSHLALGSKSQSIKCQKYQMPKVHPRAWYAHRTKSGCAPGCIST